MHNLKALAVALVLLLCSVALAQPITPHPATLPTTAPATSPAGNYAGKLQIGAFALRLGLTLEQDGENWKGILDSIDQNSKLPIDSVEVMDQTLKFGVKVIGGSFQGKIADDFSSIDGQWSQGGQTLPLKLDRIEKPLALNRPQEPKPPFPCVEEQVTFESANGTARLAGTFTKPKTGGPFPTVALITGSGPQDRDETLMGHKPFFVLADHLTRNGIAVLRYDDRGQGESTGDFSKAVIDDFVADARGALAFLRTREDVDAKQLGLIGHSEGGVVAPMVAADDPALAFIVLLAAPGVPMDELLARQAHDVARVLGWDPARLDAVKMTNQKIFAIVKSDTPPDEAKKQIRPIIDAQVATMSEEEKQQMTPAAVDQQVDTILTDWFRALVRYEPAPVLEKVKCPVLAITGEKDLQVSAKENLAGIQAALTAAGNEQFEVVEVPGLNHLFQTSETGSVAEYATIEETLSPVVLEKVTEWIRKNAE